jgi:hypothetical protein
MPWPTRSSASSASSLACTRDSTVLSSPWCPTRSRRPHRPMAVTIRRPATARIPTRERACIRSAPGRREPARGGSTGGRGRAVVAPARNVARSRARRVPHDRCVRVRRADALRARGGRLPALVAAELAHARRVAAALRARVLASRSLGERGGGHTGTSLGADRGRGRNDRDRRRRGDDDRARIGRGRPHARAWTWSRSNAATGCIERCSATRSTCAPAPPR